jgi:hypothetical protein
LVPCICRKSSVEDWHHRKEVTIWKVLGLTFELTIRNPEVKRLGWKGNTRVSPISDPDPDIDQTISSCALQPLVVLHLINQALSPFANNLLQPIYCLFILTIESWMSRPTPNILRRLQHTLDSPFPPQHRSRSRTFICPIHANALPLEIIEDSPLALNEGHLAPSKPAARES